MDITSPNAELGKNNDTLFEPDNEFLYDATNSEKVIRGQNNTWIVLGRDRPSDRASGYGGSGTQKCGTIDIVSGRLSSLKGTENLNKRVNPSFSADAARIYISQKTDIDTNFNIAKSISGAGNAASAIGIKADDVRIVARRSLKLVTSGDTTLSNGDNIVTKNGVELIAFNNDADMQPIPKGENLVGCLFQLKENILLLNGILTEFVKIQRKFNGEISGHTHFSPFFATPTSPSKEILEAFPDNSLQTFLKIEQGLRNHVVQLTNWESSYLVSGVRDYINSQYHYLN